MFRFEYVYLIDNVHRSTMTPAYILLTGPLTGGSRFQMSIIRNVNVALSNLRNAHVALSNLRNAHVTLSILSYDHVPCHYIFESHVACH